MKRLMWSTTTFFWSVLIRAKNKITTKKKVSFYRETISKFIKSGLDLRKITLFAQNNNDFMKVLLYEFGQIVKKGKMIKELPGMVFEISGTCLVSIKYPKVFNHHTVDYNELKQEYPSRSIYNLKNVDIYPQSDFLVLSDEKIYWDKIRFDNLKKIQYLDHHILNYNFETQEITYLHPLEKRQVKNAISLCGVHSNIWSHFILEQIEKLEHLHEISNSLQNSDLSQLTILLPKCNDPQIKELVKLSLKFKNLGCEILEVNSDEIIHCENYFLIDEGACLLDSAKYLSVNDILIHNSVINFWKNFKEKIFHEFDIWKGDNPDKLKIFIGRESNGRTLNPVGYKKFLDYFLQRGFIEIFPHKLSLKEKIIIFSKATHIAGILSSGVTNAIFSDWNTKIFSLTNYSRIYDSYFSSLFGDVNKNIYCYPGYDLGNGVHSNFEVDFDDMAEKLEQIDFFS